MFSGVSVARFKAKYSVIMLILKARFGSYSRLENKQYYDEQKGNSSILDIGAFLAINIATPNLM